MNSRFVKPKCYGGSNGTPRLQVWEQNDGDKVWLVFAIEETAGGKENQIEGLDVLCLINEGFAFSETQSQAVSIIVKPGNPQIRVVVHQEDEQPKQKSMPKANLPFAHHFGSVGEVNM